MLNPDNTIRRRPKTPLCGIITEYEKEIASRSQWGTIRSFLRTNSGRNSPTFWRRSVCRVVELFCKLVVKSSCTAKLGWLIYETHGKKGAQKTPLFRPLFVRQMRVKIIWFDSYFGTQWEYEIISITCGTKQSSLMSPCTFSLILLSSF